MRNLIYFLLFLPLIGRGQLIVSSSFNNAITQNTTYSPFQLVEGSMSYSVARDNTRYKTASYAVRFELRDDDPQVPFGNNRAEITIINNTNSQNTSVRWYRGWFYFPSAQWANDSKEEVVTQWHDRSSGCSASPTLALEIQNGRYRIRTRYSTQNYCTVSSSRVERTPVDLGPVDWDQWVDFTFEYFPATDNTGFIRVYKNGEQVYQLLNAPTQYIGALQMPYWKIGIYKWFWAQTNDGGSTSSLRVMYMDDVEVYGSSTTYNDIYPNNSNVPPACSAGSNQNLSGGVTSTALSGSASDPEDGVLTYLWTRESGPNTPTITSPTSLSTGVTGLIAGTYVFKLTVTDDGGLTASSTVGVTIIPANEPPVADAGPAQSLPAGTTTANLDGEATDAEDFDCCTIHGWTQISGPTTATFSPNAGDWNPTVGNLTSGSYVFQLSITDSQGATATSTVSITIAQPNTPPTVSAGSPQNLAEGATTATLTGTATDNGSVSSVVWTLESGPNTPTIASASSLSTGVTGLVPGVYVFRLTATDNLGLTASSTVTITANAVATNEEPTVSVTGNTTTLLYTNSTQLFSTGTDTDGTITGYQWAQLEGPTVTFTSNTAQNPGVSGMIIGQYVFRVIVTDDDGATGYKDLSITILPNLNKRMIRGGRIIFIN